MKSTQLLSVVLSLIMVFGVSAGSAFAQTDDVADTSIDDEIKDIETDVKDVMEDEVEDTTDEERDDEIDEDSNYARDGKRYDLDDRLAYYCGMSDDEKRQFFEDHPRLAQFSDRLENYCDLSDYSRDSKLKDFIRIHITDEDRDRVRDHIKDNVKDHIRDDVKDNVRDYVKDHKGFNLDDRLGYFCDMSDEEQRQFFEDHPRLAQFTDRLLNYCDLSDGERDGKLRDFVREHVRDEDRDRNTDSDFRHKLASWCEMTDEDKSAAAEKYGKTDEMVAKADRYCTLDESDRSDFIAEHRDEFRAHMKDRMMDKAYDKPHMDYDRLCALAESDRAAEIDDSEKLDRLSKWCAMSTDEREDYKMKHHDEMKDKVHDKMSDKAKDHMSDAAEDKMKMKLSDKSDRLKAMIMEKRDISDERRDEIRAKYIEKHGDLDEKKSELKMKFKDHMKTMRMEISDERKSSIHDRLAEMKAFKAELRERSSEMTDEEKQELRAEFIEKAKDMQLAWISPRTQMTAGINSAEVECREGFSLVMKASNGVAMCLKADTALKMIDRGLVVPAN